MFTPFLLPLTHLHCLHPIIINLMAFILNLFSQYSMTTSPASSILNASNIPSFLLVTPNYNHKKRADVALVTFQNASNSSSKCNQ